MVEKLDRGLRDGEYRFGACLENALPASVFERYTDIAYFVNRAYFHTCEDGLIATGFTH